MAAATCDKYREELLLQATSLAEVRYATGGRRPDSVLRDCRVSRLELSHPLVTAVLKTVDEANRSWWQFDVDRAQAAQFCVYSEKGHFAWHQDSELEMLPRQSQRPRRKLTAVLCMSHTAAYFGGNLELRDEAGVIYRNALIRSIGAITVFPSYCYHRVTPIESGVRTSLILWMLGPPFR